MIKKTGFLCIAILAISCMFFAGQSWAQCSGPVDTDLDGITDDLDPCDSDTTNECFLEKGDACEIFIGAHPVVPGAMLCGAGGNQLCVVEYEFCPNGTAKKKWDPDPVAGTPGPTNGTGTWSQVGNTLTIDTKDPLLMALGMRTLEVYDTAYVYYEGGKTKLDLTSTAKLTPGLAGAYDRHQNTHIWMGAAAPWFMEVNVDNDTDVTCGASGAWSYSSLLTLVSCNFPAVPTFCSTFIKPPNPTLDLGTTTTPLKTPGSLYILQIDDTLVLTRQ